MSMLPALVGGWVAASSEVGAAASATTRPGAVPVGQAATTRPNVVIILTDDQRRDDLGVMTNVQTLLAARGTTFTNGTVVSATCCPSRVSLLTGRQSHGSGVFTNGSDCHGSRPFDDRSTIATTMAAAGYRTGLVGKYRNSWVGPAAPPGWSDWHAFSGLYDNSGGAYYDYQLSHNGVLQSYGSAANDYSTDVLAPYATGFIRATPATQPLFLLFTPFGPHGGQKPAPRHLGRFSSMVIPHGPNFNEADVSDKPQHIRDLLPFTASDVKALDNARRRARESLLSVDEAVGSVVQTLQDTNRLANTLIVFSSDQGFSRGEHRVANKGVPYEEVLNIPLVARFDAVGSTPRTEARLASNIDLAPTFAALAGTSMPGADGRNLMPLLTGEVVPWRSSVLTEYVKNDAPTPSYCAIRTATEQFVSYATGELELYDLVQDPYQVDNLARDPASAAELSRLGGVAAATCSLTAWRPPTTLAAPARFVPVPPYRLLDTRAPGAFGVEKPYAGQTLSVGVVGEGAPATPVGAVAVAVNVTVTQAEGTGFLTVFPTGGSVPNASLQNFTGGTTAPNFTIAPIGAQGKVSFYVEGAATHLIVDVTGYFLPAASATAGRLVALAPARILDTRTGIGAPARWPGPNTTLELAVLGRGGIPSTGVAAVVLCVTGVDATPGFLTLWPGGMALPNVSNANFDHAGQVRANLAMVPIGPSGTVSIRTTGGAHLLADVAGYVTDATAAGSSSGLYVPVNPVRLRDTRVTPPAKPVARGGTVDVGLASGQLPSSAASVFVNLTATRAEGPGFVTLYPTGTPLPDASNLNLEAAGQTIPDSAMVKVGAGGAVTAFSSVATDLIVDASGYVTA